LNWEIGEIRGIGEIKKLYPISVEGISTLYLYTPYNWSA